MTSDISTAVQARRRLRMVADNITLQVSGWPSKESVSGYLQQRSWRLARSRQVVAYRLRKFEQDPRHVGGGP